MSLFQPAVKERLKARIAIDGPTGSGKTWTAEQWARILAGPDGLIGIVDTENRSAAYYAPSPAQLAGIEPIERLNWWDPPYEFGHFPISAPYDPRELARIIDAAGDELGPNGVLVIDSLTHFWNGEGGTLDIVDNASSRGNTFTGWKEGTPAQRYMLDKIIHAKCHVICTMRSKMEYVLEAVVSNGKTVQVPKKIGMAPEQRAGVEYEFTVVADMDLEHRLIVSKSRCSLLADLVMPCGRSSEPAHTFAAWLGSGVERIAPEAAQLLVDRMNGITNEQKRVGVKKEFVEQFGRPTELTTDRIAAATAWINLHVDPTGTVPDGTSLVGPLADALAEVDTMGEQAEDATSRNGTSDGFTADDTAPHDDVPPPTDEDAPTSKPRAARQ